MPKSFPEKTPSALAALATSPVRILRPRDAGADSLFGVPIQSRPQTSWRQEPDQPVTESLADLARKAIP
ncbi:MAG: hypothetical protein AAGL24_12710 [Pseudomonadota bacterium]